MNIDQITTEMLNAAILLQEQRTPRDSETALAFVEKLGASTEFLEYLVLFAQQLQAGEPLVPVICSAMTIGIEIGMALETLQRRPNA